MRGNGPYCTRGLNTGWRIRVKDRRRATCHERLGGRKEPNEVVRKWRMHERSRPSREDLLVNNNENEDDENGNDCPSNETLLVHSMRIISTWSV